MPGRARPVVAEAVHVDVDESAQFADQVLDVDAGTAVNIGGELSGQNRGMHARESTQPARPPPGEIGAGRSPERARAPT
jgi:hypothetical protein